MFKVNDSLYIEKNSKKLKVFWRRFSIPENLAKKINVGEYDYPALNLFNTYKYASGKKSIMFSSWEGFI
jgi:hypothetical protein